MIRGASLRLAANLNTTKGLQAGGLRHIYHEQPESP